MAFDDLDSFQQRLITSLVELMTTGRYQRDMVLRHVPGVNESPFGFKPERFELEIFANDGTRSHGHDLYQTENLNALTSTRYVDMRTSEGRTTVSLSAKAFEQYKFLNELPNEDTPKTELIRFWIKRLEPIEDYLRKGDLYKAEHSFARWRTRASNSISRLLDRTEGENLANFGLSHTAEGIATITRRTRAFLEALLEDVLKYGTNSYKRFTPDEVASDDEEMPVFPEHLLETVRVGKFNVIQVDDIRTGEDLEQLIEKIHRHPERNFYYYEENGGPHNSLIRRAMNHEDILAVEWDRHYYRHPNFVRDFVKITPKDGEYLWDWEKEVVEKGPEFIQFTLRLSERKIREIDLSALRAELKISTAPDIGAASTLTLPRREHELPKGAFLQNRYKILRSLNTGGTSRVYLALDTRLDCTVAIKETREATSGSSDTLREAFEQEARLLANLRHDCLPMVTDHFFEEGHQFIVMQFVDGNDLDKEMIQRGAPFPEGEVLNWTSDLLEVLGYLHRQNPPIIHHDVKPANIKIRNRKPVLLDFGLSRGVAGQMSTLIDGEQPKYVRGNTPAYASPEQVQGLQTDERSDLFSLASTLYHLVVGHPAVRANERLQATAVNQPDPLKPANDDNATVSLGFSDVLFKAMALNQSQRYQSAESMAIAIRSIDPTLSRSQRTGDIEPSLAVAREADEWLAFEELRSAWLTTNTGVEAGKNEFDKVCDGMQNGSEKRNKEMKQGSIILRYSRWGKFSCVVSARGISLLMTWHCPYDNTLDDAFLSVEFYPEKSDFTTGSPIHLEKDRLSATKYSLDLECGSKLVWRRRDVDHKMSTEVLVEFYLTDLLHMVVRDWSAQRS